MKIQAIRAVAKTKGVKSGRMKKAEIIRAIQAAEGNFPCFGTAMDCVCDQDGCSWREDCLTPRNAGSES